MEVGVGSQVSRDRHLHGHRAQFFNGVGLAVSRSVFFAVRADGAVVAEIPSAVLIGGVEHAVRAASGHSRAQEIGRKHDLLPVHINNVLILVGHGLTNVHRVLNLLTGVGRFAAIRQEHILVAGDYAGHIAGQVDGPFAAVGDSDHLGIPVNGDLAALKLAGAVGAGADGGGAVLDAFRVDRHAVSAVTIFICIVHDAALCVNRTALNGNIGVPALVAAADARAAVAADGGHGAVFNGDRGGSQHLILQALILLISDRIAVIAGANARAIFTAGHFYRGTCDGNVGVRFVSAVTIVAG